MDPYQQTEFEELKAASRQIQQELNSITRHLETLAEVRTKVRQLEQSLNTINQKMANLTGGAKQPPPLPPPLPQKQSAPPPPTPDWSKIQTEERAVRPPLPPPTPKKVQAEQGQTGPTFEMAVGSYWLVGLGVIFLLATLVFAGNYAYKHLILGATAAVKLSLMLIISAAITATAAWLEKRHESLVNYAHTLGAGGLAAFYYTIYAAYYVPALKVIESPILSAILLLGWSVATIAIAEWKKSELLAVFSIALSFFTTGLNPIGYFSLFTNLILTFAAVIFLIRNRWAYVTYVCMVGTYFGFLIGPAMQGAFTPENAPMWEVQIGFLLAYWAVYTFAVFSSQSPRFGTPEKIGFLSVNNAAFVALVWMVAPSAYAAHCLLATGLLLLGTTFWVRPVLGINSPIYASYLVQALAVTTGGLVAELSGPVLAIALVAESMILLVRGKLSQSLICRICAHFCAIAGFIATFWDLNDKIGGLALGIFTSTVFLVATWWLEPKKEKSSSASRTWEWIETYFYGLLGLCVGIATVSTQTFGMPQLYAPVLAAAGLILTAAAQYRKVSSLVYLSTAYFLLAQNSSIFDSTYRSYPWWNPFTVLIATVAVNWYWRLWSPYGQQIFRKLISAIYSLATVALIHAWLHPILGSEDWIVTGSALSVVLLFIGVIAADPFLAGGSQLLLFSSMVGFIALAGSQQLGAAAALVPIATIAGTAWMAENWIKLKVDEDAVPAEKLVPIGVISRVYRVVALILALYWIESYIPHASKGWFYIALGFVGFLSNRYEMDNLRYALTGMFTLFGLCYLLFEYGNRSAENPLNWLAVLMLMAQEPLHDNFAERKVGRWPVISSVVGIFALWTLIGRIVHLENLTPYKTIFWALLAVACLLSGLILRKRSYRLSGLFVLGCAILRVVFVDVWRFNDLMRIFTFFVLTVVLLGLGLIYNRYSESMRKWL